MNTRPKLAVALTLAASLTAFAEIKVNDTLSLSGYAAGSYRFTEPDPGPSTDRLDIDAVRTLFSANFKPVTGVISLYYQPNFDLTMLDAFVTMDVGGGSSVTAGKFLSPLGFESFHIGETNQISYANGDFLGPIPGYHSGVKWDYSDKETSFGLGLVDSVYSGRHYVKGDGELKHNAGFEGYFVYKAIPDVTVWAGFAYDTKGNPIHKDEEILTLDFWASYNLTKNSSIAAEYVHKDGGPGDKGYNWLVYYGYNFTRTVSSTFRVSGEKMKDGPGFTKLTVSPAYKVNDNFLVRAEVSYYDYTKYTGDTALFFGVQTLFRW